MYVLMQFNTACVSRDRAIINAAEAVHRGLRTGSRHLDQNYPLCAQCRNYVLDAADVYTDESEALSARCCQRPSRRGDRGKRETGRWAGLSPSSRQYSIVMRGIEGDVLPVAERYGMGVLSWCPRPGGWLTGRYRKRTAHDGAARITTRAVDGTLDRHARRDRRNRRAGHDRRPRR